MIDALNRVRETVITLRRLKEQYDALQPAPHSPRLDGMPRATGYAGASDAVDALIDMRDELAARIEQGMHTLSQLQRTIRPFLSALPTHQLTFCLYYYFDALRVTDAARLMGKTERWAYKCKRKLLATLRDASGNAPTDGRDDRRCMK